MSRPLSRRLSKVEDTIYGARKSIEDLTDAELERVLGILLAQAYGEDVTESDAAFYALLKPILADSRGHYEHLSDEALNALFGRLVGNLPRRKHSFSETEWG